MALRPRAKAPSVHPTMASMVMALSPSIPVPIHTSIPISIPVPTPIPAPVPIPVTNPGGELQAHGEAD